jgi:hypothetical protein
MGSDSTRDDIFISYAHLDNASLSDGRDGWVSAFEADLSALLAGRLGKKPTIWRDRRLAAEDVFSDELVERVRTARVLLSILSPRYVNSEWCRRELETFVDHAQRSGELVVRSERGIPKSRVLKVMKHHVPWDQHPTEFPDTLGVPFYAYDEDEDRETPFDQRFGADAARQYFAQMNDLAQSTARLLQAMDTPPAAAERVVWLAWTTRDRRDDRAAIARDLSDHGFTVLPAGPAPDYGPDFEAVVREGLERAELSLNLVGARYGAVLEDAEQSTVEVQLRLAQARLDAGLFSLIHVQGGLDADPSRRGALVHWLLNDATAHARTDLLSGPLEELKTELFDRLAESAPKVTSVFLAEVDSELEPLRARLSRALSALGHEVLPTTPLGLEPGYRERATEVLKRCTHSVHLLGRLYGAVPEAEERSTVDLQQELAQGLDLVSLVWVAPGEPEPRQATLIQAVSARTEVVGVDEDELEGALAKRLFVEPEPEPEPESDEPKVVYVLFAERDGEGVDGLLDALAELEAEPRLPEQGDPEEVHAWHQECMRDADAVVLWFETGGQRWAHALLQEVRKAPALRDGRPLPVAVVRAPGKRFAGRGVSVLDADDAAGLAAFLAGSA